MTNNDLSIMLYNAQGDDEKVRLITCVTRLKGVVSGLKRGDCWCEMAVGNPMVTSHSASCLAAARVMQ